MSDITTMKYCIGCIKDKPNDTFYRKIDSHCKDCINEYQREQRKRIKEEKKSEDIIIRIVDKLLEEKYSVYNEDIISKLDEIDKKLDCLINRSVKSCKK